MNPYEVDIEKLKESVEIKDEKEILKLSLVSAFLKAVSKMTTEEVIRVTGLHKSDLSRLRSLSLNRFTIDRIVSLLDTLGFSTQVNVKPKIAS